MEEHLFGIKVKKRREELNLSQKDLAAAMDLDQGKVSLIEKGLRKVDSATELPRLAKVLKCSISWFYEDEKEVTKEQTPVESLLKQYFPDISFTEFETRRITQFLEPVINSYIQTDPKFSKRIQK